MVQTVGSKGGVKLTGTDMGTDRFSGYSKQGVVDSSKAIKTKNKISFI